jgi:hypothetical protein
MRFLYLLLPLPWSAIQPVSGRGDPLQPWFDSLRNKAGLFCCASADGHPLCSAANVRFRSHVARRLWATAKGG